jgi:hypothetical protein
MIINKPGKTKLDLKQTGINFGSWIWIVAAGIFACTGIVVGIFALNFLQVINYF